MTTDLQEAFNELLDILKPYWIIYRNIRVHRDIQKGHRNAQIIKKKIEK